MQNRPCRLTEEIAKMICCPSGCARSPEMVCISYQVEDLAKTVIDRVKGIGRDPSNPFAPMEKSGRCGHERE